MLSDLTKSDKGVEKMPNKINVTNIERTVVDCIDDIGKAKGIYIKN